MRYTSFLIVIALSVLWNSCTQPNGKIKEQTPPQNIILEPLPGESVATFAAGCFWCSEEIFESLKGVRDAISGYAGGKADDATYEAVSSGRTDHAESVQVYYDSSVISFALITAAFFDGHDPTTLNRQGPDSGTQYRSIAFYRNEAEKQIILEEIRRIDSSGIHPSNIVTQVIPFTAFYPAEPYHQNYIEHNPDDPYVKAVSKPRFEKFKREFEKREP